MVNKDKDLFICANQTEKTNCRNKAKIFVAMNNQANLKYKRVKRGSTYPGT
jgi:hypothetical protein